MVTCTFSQLEGDRWRCDACGQTIRSTTANIYAECGISVDSPRTCGPGCQLRRTLAWWRVRDDGSCGCHEYAAMMDAWGPDECWRRLEEIVEHLRQAAAEKGLPFLATAARIMVGRAIEAARKELSHVEGQAANGAGENRGGVMDDSPLPGAA